MKELKEIRISDSEIILKDNLVKSNILPTNSSELTRNVKIQGDSIIEGSVFGNKIEINDGNVEFNGAVFSNSELYINSNIKNKVVFKKAVASADSISALSVSQTIVFWSDINAKKVKLKNCYIGGSVFAQDIYLENCIVLGGVFATKQNTITNSMIGTFHSPSVELSGTNYLLYPACFSVEPLSILPNTEMYNLSLADLGSLFKNEKEKDNTGKIKMDIENDKQRTVLVGDNDSTTVVNSYSVSGRVLAADVIDFDKLENHFLIEAGSLGTQILKVYSLNKEDGSKSNDLSVDNIAEFLFKILKGNISIQDLSGEIDFEEIKKSFGN